MCDDGAGPCRWGTKLDALKLAAKDLANIVVWDDQSRFTSKMALIPFSTRVRVGPDGGGGNMMKWLTDLDSRWSGYMSECTDSTGSNASETDGNWTCTASTTQQVTDWRIMPCVTDRTASAEFTDARPASGAWLNAHDGSRAPRATNSTDTALSSGRGQTSDDPSPQWNYNWIGKCYDVAQSNEIVPLSADRQMLLNQIDGLEAYGATSGALASAFS